MKETQIKTLAKKEETAFCLRGMVVGHRGRGVGQASTKKEQHRLSKQVRGPTPRRIWGAREKRREDGEEWTLGGGFRS